MQLRGDAGEDVAPIADAALPKQPCGRIPRKVVAIEKPAPVRDASQRDEQRTRERAGQMRDRRVGRHDEIERHHQSGAVDERAGLVEARVKRLDAKSNPRDLLGAKILLQRNQPHTRDRGERCEFTERNRSAPVGLVVRAALPANADLEPVPANVLAPAGDERSLSAATYWPSAGTFATSCSASSSSGIVRIASSCRSLAPGEIAVAERIVRPDLEQDLGRRRLIGAAKA